MNLMLDFETLGTDFDTICLSLGAVAFNRDGIIAEKLFDFDLKDQVGNKRTFSAETLQWWMRQSDEARKVFLPGEDKLSIAEFSHSFGTFIDGALFEVDEERDELKCWGNGANFDVVLAENLIKAAGDDIPWKFWNVWCFRTFDKLTDCKRLFGKPNKHGTHHNALDDARYQTNAVLNYYKVQDEKKRNKK